VRAPPIGVLFPILIGKRWLKGAAMQIQLNDVRGGECLLRQGGEEEFVDDPCSGDPNGTLLVAGRMRGHYHPASHVCRPYWHLRTIVEAPHGLTFRALLRLIRRQVETRLHERVSEHGVLLTAGHKGEAGQIRKHGSCALLAIEPEERTPLRELVGPERAINGGEPLTQFLPVAPVAFVSNTAEPTFSCAPG
jgi:hypothetical protein